MTETIPHNDKREQKRYAGVYAEYALIQSAEDQENAKFRHCFIRDFSASGAGIFISEAIPQHTLILMRLYDPNISTPIEVLGGIVWSRTSDESPSGRARYDVGIKFLHIEDKDISRLDLMIDHFESLAHRPQRVSDLI